MAVPGGGQQAPWAPQPAHSCPGPRPVAAGAAVSAGATAQGLSLVPAVTTGSYRLPTVGHRDGYRHLLEGGTAPLGGGPTLQEGAGGLRGAHGGYLVAAGRHSVGTQEPRGGTGGVVLEARARVLVARAA